MTARVNLLPVEVAERAKARRTTGWTIGGLVVWTALLGGVYVLKSGAVDDERAARDVAAGRVAQLQAQRAGLQRFAQLDETRTARVELLRTAMATEISWSRVLNDVSLSFPGSASLMTLSAGLAEVGPGAAAAAGAAAAPATATPTPAGGTPATPGPGAATPSPAPSVGPTAAPDTSADETPVATVTFTGYSIERFSPGVEAVLLRFEDVRSFFDAYLTIAEGVERGGVGVTSFEGTVQLSDEAYTRRYAEGLPEEVG